MEVRRAGEVEGGEVRLGKGGEDQSQDGANVYIRQGGKGDWGGGWEGRRFELFIEPRITWAVHCASSF